MEVTAEHLSDKAKVDYALVERAKKGDQSAYAELMERYRESRGVYTAAGGCIDTTREFARWVCPGTADLVLPTVR